MTRAFHSFLPPYSPNFNPIEEFFSGLKSWMKRHFELAVNVSFGGFLEAAVTANSGESHVKAHFSHAGSYYRVDLLLFWLAIVYKM